MKKLLNLILIGIIVLSATACNNTEINQPSAINNTTESSIEFDEVNSVEEVQTEENSNTLNTEDSNDSLHEVEVNDPIQLNTNKVVTPTKTDIEYAYEFINAYASHNYKIVINGIPNDAEWVSNRIALNDIICAYNAKMCSTSNICSTTYYCKNGEYYICMNGDTPCYTVEELINLDSQALEIAKSIYNEVHDDSLSEYEQVQNYIQAFYNLNVQVPLICKTRVGVDGLTTQEIINNSTIDNLYSILVARSGSCNAAVGAFNLVMDLEGIQAYGLKVKNHIVTYLLLDDTEYFSDWYNHIEITPINELLNYYEIDQFYNLDFIRTLI